MVDLHVRLVLGVPAERASQVGAELDSVPVPFDFGLGTSPDSNAEKGSFALFDLLVGHEAVEDGSDFVDRCFSLGCLGVV